MFSRNRARNTSALAVVTAAPTSEMGFRARASRLGGAAAIDYFLFSASEQSADDLAFSTSMRRSRIGIAVCVARISPTTYVCMAADSCSLGHIGPQGLSTV